MCVCAHGHACVYAFNQLAQYTSSPGNWAYCYAELAISSLTVAISVASSHCAHPGRDGEAVLAWLARYTARESLPVWYGMVWYGIVEFNVPLDTVYAISETTTLSSDVHLPFSNGGPAT